MNESEDIRFAVVGLGMGQTHAVDIVDARGARLAAVCDIDEERLNLVGDKYGVTKYVAYDDLLKDDEIDVVNICVPSGMHSDFTVMAAEAGKHVIAEKPEDVSLEKIDAMIAATKKAGVKLQVIFQERFVPLNRKIKEAIDTGRLGKLVGIHGDVRWYRAQSYYEGRGAWKGTWNMDGGGSLMNQGVHTVDLMQWLAGPVKSVFGAMGVFTHNMDTEDKTAAILKFENGTIGTINTMTSAYPGLDTGLFIHGEKGSMVKSDGDLIAWRIQGEQELEEEKTMLATYGPKEKRDATVASDPMALSWRGHLLQIEDMVRAIREDSSPTITGEGARHAVEIVLAIYDSARTGKEVFLS